MKRGVRNGWNEPPGVDAGEALQALARAVAFLVLVGLAILGWKIVEPEHQLQRKLDADIAERASTLDGIAASLDRERLSLELIRRDPDVIETLSRDQIDLHREGETIFRIEGRPSSPTVPGGFGTGHP